MIVWHTMSLWVCRYEFCQWTDDNADEDEMDWDSLWHDMPEPYSYPTRIFKYFFCLIFKSHTLQVISFNDKFTFLDDNMLFKIFKCVVGGGCHFFQRLTWFDCIVSKLKLAVCNIGLECETYTSACQLFD